MLSNLDVENNYAFTMVLLTVLCDWLAQTRAIFSTNDKQKLNQSCLARTRFPALGAGYMHLLGVLVGSLHCLGLFSLTGVIILVWVLRHLVKAPLTANDITT